MIKPPKSPLRKTTHNRNARAAQHYSIVEYLAQDPCAMLALEVLQTCPMQWKALLLVTGGLDTTKFKLITFDTEHSAPRLSHQLDFQIQVMVMQKLIHRMVVDEGATTSVMSISCWKALDSPPITPSPTILTMFDGRSFSPYGIFTTLPITLGGKIVTVEVEVIDRPLECNLLLGRIWTYAMKAVPSAVFHTISFSHQGKIIIVDQLDFCTSDLRTNTKSTIPLINDSSSKPEIIGAGLFKDSSLMGLFPSSPPHPSLIVPINMISTHTSYDPWIIPHLDKMDSYGTVMPL